MNPTSKYSRQLLAEGMDPEKQSRIRKSRIAVIGAGGLGCAVLQYLAGTGVGIIEIIDFDIVEESNLHRQTLYAESDVGDRKCNAAARRIRQINSDVVVLPRFMKFTGDAFFFTETPDLIIDGTDNFESKYAISDFCKAKNIPWIFGAIYQFSGQVAVFNYHQNQHDNSCSLSDLYPAPPPASISPSCSTVGVIGITVGIIGCMQAMEAFKIITGLGGVKTNSVLTYDALDQSLATLRYATPLLHDANFQNLNSKVCALETTWLEALNRNGRSALIDVREHHEILSSASVIDSLHIPLADLADRIGELSDYDDVYVFCSTGVRSKIATRFLTNFWRQAYSVSGGYASFRAEQVPNDPADAV